MNWEGRHSVAWVGGGPWQQAKQERVVKPCDVRKKENWEGRKAGKQEGRQAGREAGRETAFFFFCLFSSFSHMASSSSSFSISVLFTAFSPVITNFRKCSALTRAHTHSPSQEQQVRLVAKVHQLHSLKSTSFSR